MNRYVARGLKVLAIAAALVLAAVAAGWGYEKVFISSDAWYAQVDNEKLTTADENNNGFDYHYDLPAVSAEGATETLGVDTSRELREGAYLRLETLALRGVSSWEEVAWDEIPAAAQEKLVPPESQDATEAIAGEASHAS